MASWRYLLTPEAEASPQATAVLKEQVETQWDKLKQDLRHIMLFADDLDPLPDIVGAYQNRLSAPVCCDATLPMFISISFTDILNRTSAWKSVAPWSRRHATFINASFNATQTS